MAWILIVYLSSGYGGGPMAVRFDDKRACEAAISAVKRTLPIGSYICVPAASPTTQAAE